MAASECTAKERSNDDKIITTVEDVYISKFRQALPQCCAVSAKNLLLLTYGSTLGFSTILIPALQDESSDIPLTLDELTWISSLNLFLVPIGCFMSGPIAQYLGRKRTMMLANIPFVVSWLLYYYANNSTMLFTALSLTGLTGGFLEGSVLIYVAEVTQPYLRGILSATSSMAVTLGVFSQMLSGNFFHWRTVALINLTYPIICFVALSLVPESPHWLAVKGRLKDSERALCWLRGWVNPSNVKDEFQELCKQIQKSADVTDSDRKTWRLYTKRAFYLPFLLVSTTFFISIFSGGSPVQTYAVVIFEQLKAPIDSYTATVFLGIAQLIGTLICIIVIHFMGRRKLSFISIGSTFLGFFAIAIYNYLSDMNYLDEMKYTWLPTTLLIGVAFTSHLGIRLLPWILIGEVFPSTIRSNATGVSGSVGYIFTSIANKSFLYMVNGMSLAGTFFFYALINLFGGCLLYVILPETEGRTLKEIEDHYAGVQNLKDRPRKEQNIVKEKWAASNPAIVYDENSESKL